MVPKTSGCQVLLPVLYELKLPNSHSVSPCMIRMDQSCLKCTKNTMKQCKSAQRDQKTTRGGMLMPGAILERVRGKQAARCRTSCVEEAELQHRLNPKLQPWISRDSHRQSWGFSPSKSCLRFRACMRKEQVLSPHRVSLQSMHDRCISRT